MKYFQQIRYLLLKNRVSPYYYIYGDTIKQIIWE